MRLRCPICAIVMDKDKEGFLSCPRCHWRWKIEKYHSNGELAMDVRCTGISSWDGYKAYRKQVSHSPMEGDRRDD